MMFFRSTVLKSRESVSFQRRLERSPGQRAGSTERQAHQAPASPRGPFPRPPPPCSAGTHAAPPARTCRQAPTARMQFRPAASPHGTQASATVTNSALSIRQTELDGLSTRPDAALGDALDLLNGHAAGLGHQLLEVRVRTAYASLDESAFHIAGRRSRIAEVRKRRRAVAAASHLQLLTKSSACTLIAKTPIEPVMESGSATMRSPAVAIQ